MTALTRSHYGDFSHSIITTFQLLVGDSWSGVLYAAMQSQEEPHQQVFAAVFVLTWFIFGSLVANNLFVAVIMDNFDYLTRLSIFLNILYISICFSLSF